MKARPVSGLCFIRAPGKQGRFFRSQITSVGQTMPLLAGVKERPSPGQVRMQGSWNQPTRLHTVHLTQEGLTSSLSYRASGRWGSRRWRQLAALFTPFAPSCRSHGSTASPQVPPAPQDPNWSTPLPPLLRFLCSLFAAHHPSTSSLHSTWKKDLQTSQVGLCSLGSQTFAQGILCLQCPLLCFSVLSPIIL